MSTKKLTTEDFPNLDYWAQIEHNEAVTLKAATNKIKSMKEKTPLARAKSLLGDKVKKTSEAHYYMMLELVGTANWYFGGGFQPDEPHTHNKAGLALYGSYLQDKKGNFYYIGIMTSPEFQALFID